MINYNKIIESKEKTGKAIYYDSMEYAKINRTAEDYKTIEGIYFTKKDLKDITYRTINYWDEKGYLFLNKNMEGEWRRFNLVHMVWIRFLDTLRELGVSVDDIVTAMFGMFGYIPALKNDEIKEAAAKLPEKQRDKLLTLIGYSVENFESGFRFYVYYALFLRKPIAIRYYKEGFCEVVKGITNESFPLDIKEYVEGLNKSFISISLNELIQQFISSQKLEVIGSLNILSENEMELLAHIRRKEVKEIKVQLEDGSPVLLEIIDTKENTDLSKRIYEYITSPYQRIEFKTNGGKTAYFERVTKVKLPSK